MTMTMTKEKWRDRILEVTLSPEYRFPDCEGGTIRGRLRWAIRNLEVVVEAANAHLKTDPLHDHAEPLMGGRFWVMPNGVVAFSEKPPVEVTATPTEVSTAAPETTPETPTTPESVSVPTLEPTPQETILVEAPSKKLPPISVLREAADAAGIDITDLGVTKEDKREIQKRLQEHKAQPQPEPEPEPETPPEPQPKKMVKTSVALTPAQMIEVVEDTGPSLSEIASGNIPEKVEEPPKDKGPSLQDIIAASAKVKPEEVRPPKDHDPDSFVDDLVPEDAPVFDDEGDDSDQEEDPKEDPDGDLDSLVDGILDDTPGDSLEEIEKREDAALDDLF